MNTTNHDDLVTAMERRWLVTVRMHDGEMIEYAEVVELPERGEGASQVWVRPYRMLSGRRFTPKGNRKKLAIHSIASVTFHQDMPVPD